MVDEGFEGFKVKATFEFCVERDPRKVIDELKAKGISVILENNGVDAKYSYRVDEITPKE